jgi:hypothetical protein
MQGDRIRRLRRRQHEDEGAASFKGLVGQASAIRKGQVAGEVKTEAAAS